MVVNLKCKPVIDCTLNNVRISPLVWVSTRCRKAELVAGWVRSPQRGCRRLDWQGEEVAGWHAAAGGVVEAWAG